MVEPRTLDASLVVSLWMERHDRVLRARIIEGGLSRDSARGIDAIGVLVRDALESLELELSKQFDRS